MVLALTKNTIRREAALQENRSESYFEALRFNVSKIFKGRFPVRSLLWKPKSDRKDLL